MSIVIGSRAKPIRQCMDNLIDKYSRKTQAFNNEGLNQITSNYIISWLYNGCSVLHMVLGTKKTYYYTSLGQSHL